MAVAAIAVPAAISIAEFGISEHQASKAKKEAAKQQTTRPKLPSSPYNRDAIQLAQSELANPISGQAKQAFKEGEDKDYATALEELLKGGGSVNDVGKLFSGKEEGRVRQTMLLENLRLNKLNNLSRAQGVSEESRQEEFEFNQWRPWADTTQAVAASREQSKDNANKALTSFVSTASSAISTMYGDTQTNAVNNYNTKLAADQTQVGTELNPNNPDSAYQQYAQSNAATGAPPAPPTPASETPIDN